MSTITSSILIKNFEASVTSYVYEIRPKIRGPFDGCKRVVTFSSTSLGNNPSRMLISSTSWFVEVNQLCDTEFVKN